VLLKKTGPPRQRITLCYNDTPADFIIANSQEDWHMFKQEVEEYFGITDLKICELGKQGTERCVPLEWFELKADRKYTLYSRVKGE